MCLEAKLDNLTLNLDIIKRKVTRQESALLDVDAMLQDLKAIIKVNAVSLDSTNKLTQREWGTLVVLILSLRR